MIASKQILFVPAHLVGRVGSGFDFQKGLGGNFSDIEGLMWPT